MSGGEKIGNAYAVFLTVQKVGSIKNLIKKKLKRYKKYFISFVCNSAVELAAIEWL